MTFNDLNVCNWRWRCSVGVLPCTTRCYLYWVWVTWENLRWYSVVFIFHEVSSAIKCWYMVILCTKICRHWIRTVGVIWNHHSGPVFLCHGVDSWCLHVQLLYQCRPGLMWLNSHRTTFCFSPTCRQRPVTSCSQCSLTSKQPLLVLFII